MTIQEKPLTEITHHALHVLTREIGVANTMRFLGQFSTGTGNYTEERSGIFGDITLDDVLSEIRAKSPSSQR